MLFTRENGTDLTIRSVERNAIRIGDETLTASVALTADRIIGEWRASAIDELTVADLESVLAEEPEMLVLGTGWQQRLPPRELMFGLARRGIGLEMMDTPAACRTFNILIAEGRRPAAVLLLD
ncbi:MAG: MTH938/NDUFAF3 family protein [Woeseia sp.]